MDAEKSQYAWLLGSLRGRRQLTADEFPALGRRTRKEWTSKKETYGIDWTRRRKRRLISRHPQPGKHVCLFVCVFMHAHVRTSSCYTSIARYNNNSYISSNSKFFFILHVHVFRFPPINIGRISLILR